MFLPKRMRPENDDVASSPLSILLLLLIQCFADEVMCVGSIAKLANNLAPPRTLYFLQELGSTRYV